MVCETPIGQGNSLCIKFNCTNARHRKSKRGEMIQGNLCVLRNRSSIFLAPTIQSFNTSNEMVKTWSSELKNLNEWTKPFSLAAN